MNESAGKADLARLAKLESKLVCRAQVIAGIRAFFCARGFLEVETPLRVPAVAPEQYILPYTSEGWFLSTSPELPMKRLLAAGYERIFQVCHCFRQEERGRWHNPEFTMLEWYRARADYRETIRDTEQLVCALASDFGQGSVLAYQGQRIDLSQPWLRLTVQEAYRQWAGWDPFETFDAQRFDDDMALRIIPRFPPDRPLVLLDYPPECASLARLRWGQPSVAERVEIFIGGLEITNGFSELTDAAEQERRFREEMAQMRRAGKPAILPERFLATVRHLPQCTGNALGVDRLVMLLCDAASIDEVMAFPVDYI